MISFLVKILTFKSFGIYKFLFKKKKNRFFKILYKSFKKYFSYSFSCSFFDFFWTFQALENFWKILFKNLFTNYCRFIL